MMLNKALSLAPAKIGLLPYLQLIKMWLNIWKSWNCQLIQLIWPHGTRMAVNQS